MLERKRKAKGLIVLQILNVTTSRFAPVAYQSITFMRTFTPPIKDYPPVDTFDHYHVRADDALGAVLKLIHEHEEAFKGSREVVLKESE